MAGNRKALNAAVDAALEKVCAEIGPQFPEFTADEITRAVFDHAGPRRKRGAEREAARKKREADKALWAKLERELAERQKNPAAAAEQRQAQRRADEERREAERKAYQEQHKRLQEEQEAYLRERQAEAELNRKIINEGYRVLAKKLHPDAGGDPAVMRRLNRGRDRLRSNV